MSDSASTSKAEVCLYPRAVKFNGKWHCIYSENALEFFLAVGLDRKEAEVGALSKPIIEIQATPKGFKETITFPEIDDTLFEEGNFEFNVGQKLIGSWVVWNINKDCTQLKASNISSSGETYTITRTLDPIRENYFNQKLKIGDIVAYWFGW